MTIIALTVHYSGTQPAEQRTIASLGALFPYTGGVGKQGREREGRDGGELT